MRERYKNFWSWRNCRAVGTKPAKIMHRRVFFAWRARVFHVLAYILDVRSLDNFMKSQYPLVFHLLYTI